MYKVEITNKNKYELELDRANVVVGIGGEVDLSNYYTKAETYSKEEVDEMMPTLEWIDV
uniref:Uncharacterized protein n=1 Tax=Siphoviridae sp. ctREU2 TaxID=2826333 RepID=A0A8S5NKI1_9CAUD|nr:MAG TPA: hypothetical protein [Siphoviridae sp. ctREU2]